MAAATNIDELFKKLNNKKSKTTATLDDVRLKRQITIDRKRYEQGLALEKALLSKNVMLVAPATEVELVKSETAAVGLDLRNIKIEDVVNDKKLENELDRCLEAAAKSEPLGDCDSDCEIIETNVNSNQNVIEEVVLSGVDDDEDDDDDDVILLDIEDELRTKLSNLSINKIIKVEPRVKEQPLEQQQTTTIMFDSMLGTISGQNDQFINELAQQLSTNLNLPVVFMTAEEFELYKASQNVLQTSSDEATNSEMLLTNDGESDQSNNSLLPTGSIKIRGQALIQYLFGDCSDSFKNAISRRDSTLSELRTHFDSQRKPNTKPISYYITKKKARKLEFQRKFKKIENQLLEAEKNRNELLTHLYIDYNSLNQNFDNDNYVIIDVSVYKSFLYTCTLSGRCNVYNVVNHRLINSTSIEEGAHFIQPLYNDSRFYLSVLIGGGAGAGDTETKLHIYDSILKHRRFSIDLKSQIRCVVFRYHRLYCGLNSGEVISLNRHLNNIDRPVKVTDKKISSIGVALYNFEKLLLVGAYDGRIHVLQTKTQMCNDYEYRNQFLSGHKMPPLSIKCHHEYAYSCSAEGHILAHSLRTHELISKLDLKTPITSLVIQHGNLLSAGTDGLIRCYSLNNPKNLTLCQQYYGYNRAKARVMCMKCENNFIYYGDDKGYVESIEINFEKRHLCMFDACRERPFATKAYLLEHVLGIHYNEESTSANTIVKCDWHTCNQLVEFSNLKIHLLRHF